VRVGMVTPSSNTVVEPVLADMVHGMDSITVHFARLRVTRISLEPEDVQQFAVSELTAAAQLLSDAKVDVVAWCGTAGSWLGLDHDRSTCAAIEAACDIPATTSTIGLLAAFEAHRTRRLGIITPYTQDVTDCIAGRYAELGFPPHASRSFGLSENFAFALVSEAELTRACEELAGAGCDTVAVVCTNVRAAGLAELWEARYGVLMIDSVAATLWHCLQRYGSAPRISGFGRLFVSAARSGATGQPPSAREH
jgi:maleate isomerase